MKSISIITIFATIFLSQIKSQDTLYIYKSGNLVEKYATQKIDSLSFSGSAITQDTLDIYLTGATNEKYATSSIDSITFYYPVINYTDCGFSNVYDTLPNLLTNGGFEDSKLGVISNLSYLGDQWYASGIGIVAPRQSIEVININDLPTDIDKCFENGSQLIKVTLNSEFINSSNFTNIWQLTMVNTINPVDTGRKFQFMGKIWSDITGRKIQVAGGIYNPGYTDMIGTTEIILNQGWNEWSVEIEHPQIAIDAGTDNHVRCQLNYGYHLNEGVTFYIDDFRLVDIGPRE